MVKLVYIIENFLINSKIVEKKTENEGEVCRNDKNRRS